MEQITEHVGFQPRTTENDAAEYYIKLGGGTPTILPLGVFTVDELHAIADHQKLIQDQRTDLTPRSVAAMKWVNPLDPLNYDMSGLRTYVKALLRKPDFADSRVGKKLRTAVDSNDRNLLLQAGPDARQAFFRDPSMPTLTVPAPSEEQRHRIAVAETERYESHPEPGQP